MNTRILYVVSAVAALSLVLAAALWFQNRSLRHSLNTAEIKSQHFDAHCRALRVAVEAEIAQLAVGKEAPQQERQLGLIFEQLTSPAVGLAACASGPVDEARLAVCWTNHDDACVITMARMAAARLPR